MKELAKLNAEKFLSEGTISTDLSLPSLKIDDILFRLYAKPLVGSFGSTIPVSKPVGSVFSLLRDYEEDMGDEEVINTYGDVGETDTIRQMKFKAISKPLTFKTKKLATAWTQEAIQDFTYLFVNNKQESKLSQILADELTNEAILEIDYDCFNAMYNAAQKDTWQMESKIGTLFSFEIIQKITEAGMNMFMKTSYGSRISIFCSKRIAGKLAAHPNFVKPFDSNEEIKNIYYQGKIGNIDVYADIYEYAKNKTSKDFILIGLKDEKNGLHSSIVYYPYTTSIYSAPSQNGSNDVYYYNVTRYGYNINTGKIDQSDPISWMLKFVEIDY